MALSSLQAYYQAAKQLEKDYDDLLNVKKRLTMPGQSDLYTKIFSPSITVEQLYQAAAQSLSGKDLQKLTQDHTALKKNLPLAFPGFAASEAKKPSSNSSFSKKPNSSQSQQAFSRQKASSTSHAQKTSSASTSRAPSKPSNSDGLYATQLMTMVENDNSLQDIAKTYIYMTATSQFRGYKLLCKINGGVVEDVEKEGMVHLIKNPKSLLNRVSYHGQTMSIIEHLIVKAGGKPLCVDVEPHIPEPWETNVPNRTKEEIHTYLNKCLTMWCRNPDEPLPTSSKEWESNKKEDDSILTVEEWEASRKEQRPFNQSIFRLVKSQTRKPTPMEFIGALQGRGGTEPRRIGEIALQFDPKEGQFYKLDKYLAKENKPPLKEPTEEYEMVDENHNFSEAIKKTGNHLYLYLDGKTQSCILINGKMYPAIGLDRRGSKEPSYRFKQGDVVCEGNGTYLFTVGKNGTILHPGNEKNPYTTSEQADSQSKQFALGLAMIIDFKRDHSTYNTTKARAGEVETLLLPGFSVPSTTKSTERAAIAQAEEVDYKKRGDLTFIDVPNDPVLKSLIAYLEKEFEVMEYTETQKMMRIALLSADLLRNEVESYKFKGNNYQLGEVVRAGAGDAKHKSMLNKVLCDAFKLPCAFIFGLVDVKQQLTGAMTGTLVRPDAGLHAWNIVQVDARRYLVDSAKEIIFPLDNPPGTTSQAKQELKDYYGARN